MTTWKIKDLKGVGDVELELDDSKRVFVFLGSNGVGKTKILESLSYIFSNTIEKDGFMFLKHGDAITNIDLETDSNDLQYWNFSQPSSGIFTKILLIQNLSYNINLKNTCFIDSKERSFIKQKPKIQNDLTGLAVFRNFGEHDIRYWIIEKAQSVNPYQKKSKLYENEIECFIKALNTLDKRIDNSLSIDESNVYLNISGKERELSELSSGFASVVKIIQSIISAYSKNNETENLLESKGVVLIDEIENHLHLEWQTKIIPTLKNLFPNTIFYIATHSPLVLSQLSQGEAYLLKRDNDGVVRSEKINNPNGRLFSTVLNDAFGINLNQLKRQNMESSDQSEAKKKLLALLNDKRNGEGNFSD